jgi:AhpD family alkylhydroperoxidase
MVRRRAARLDLSGAAVSDRLAAMATTHPKLSFSRLNPYRELPDGYRAMAALEEAVVKSGLDPLLLELVRTRVSQLNGCAFCLDMHQRDARAKGERQQRLDLLAAWREAPGYDARERAALGLAEALTLVAGRGLAEDAWHEAEHAFEKPQLSALVFAIASINAWNRLSIASGALPPVREEDAS